MELIDIDGKEKKSRWLNRHMLWARIPKRFIYSWTCDYIKIS